MEDIDEKLDKIFLLYSLNQMTEYLGNGAGRNATKLKYKYYEDASSNCSTHGNAKSFYIICEMCRQAKANRTAEP